MKKTHIIIKSAALALVLAVTPARATVLLSDNFNAAGTPDTSNLDYNLAGRQGGSLATVTWTGAINAQVGNPTGGNLNNGNFLLTAQNGYATLNHNFNTAGAPLSISFDMKLNINGDGVDSSAWSGIVIGDSTPNMNAANTFGILFRLNGGYQAFANADGGTSGTWTAGTPTDMHHFEFILSDGAGTGTAFGAASQKIQVFVDSSLMDTFTGTYLGLTNGFFTNTTTDAQAGALLNLSIGTVPEPATWVLLALGGTFLMVMRRRKEV